MAPKKLSKLSQNNYFNKYFNHSNTNNILLCWVIHKVELLFLTLSMKILHFHNFLLWIDLSVEIFRDSENLTFQLYWFMILKMMDIQYGRANFFINNWLILNFSLTEILKIRIGYLIIFGTRCWTFSVNTHQIEKEGKIFLVISELYQCHLQSNRKALKSQIKSKFKRKYKKKKSYKRMLYKKGTNERNRSHHQYQYKSLVRLIH